MHLALTQILTPVHNAVFLSSLLSFSASLLDRKVGQGVRNLACKSRPGLSPLKLIAHFIGTHLLHVNRSFKLIVFLKAKGLLTFHEILTM